MKARKAEIPVVGLEGLEGFLNEEETGLKGSATRVRKIVIPESQERAGAVYRDDIPAALNALIEVLKDTKVLEVTQGEGI
jgi:electron transfer flavoprotein beta subunit